MSNKWSCKASRWSHSASDARYGRFWSIASKSKSISSPRPERCCRQACVASSLPGVGHAANDAAHCGGDLRAVQAQLGEFVLQGAWRITENAARCVLRAACCAPTLRARTSPSVARSTFWKRSASPASITRFTRADGDARWPGHMGWRDAGRRRLQGYQLRSAALRQGLSRLRQG